MSSRIMAPIMCKMLSKEEAIRMSQKPQQIAPFRLPDLENRGSFLDRLGCVCCFLVSSACVIGGRFWVPLPCRPCLPPPPPSFFNKPLFGLASSSDSSVRGSDAGDASFDVLLKEKRGMVLDGVVCCRCEE